MRTFSAKRVAEIENIPKWIILVSIFFFFAYKCTFLSTDKSTVANTRARNKEK